MFVCLYVYEFVSQLAATLNSLDQALNTDRGSIALLFKDLFIPTVSSMQGRTQKSIMGKQCSGVIHCSARA